MSCQRHILETCWYDFVTDDEVVDRTHQESHTNTETMVSSQVRRLPDTPPAHTALHLSIDARSGRRVNCVNYDSAGPVPIGVTW